MCKEICPTVITPDICCLSTQLNQVIFIDNICDALLAEFL
jgi:hypothetical protein